MSTERGGEDEVKPGASLTPGTASGALFKKLKPGPGLTAGQVRANQRARICGALVELVAAKGYRAASVRRISALAGVSTRTFYDCFTDLEDCFIATHGLIGHYVLGRTAKVTADGEDGIRERIRVAFATVGDDPRLGRFLLVEPYAAGSRVLERACSTTQLIEQLVREGAAAGPNRVPAPPRMVQGMAGAVLRVARTRVLHGDRAETPRVANEFVDWALALRDRRVGNLHRLGQWDGAAPSLLPQSEIEIADDRQYLLRAAARLGASESYANLTIPRIRREAKVSRRRFDENFEGVADCFLEAVETELGTAVERAVRGALDAESWERGVVRMLAFLVATVAHDPVLARLGFIELLAPGRAGLELRERMFTEWAERLRESAPSASRPSDLAAEASIAAVWEMAAAEVAAGRSRHLTEQVPGMAYFVLAPTVGAAAAEEAITAELTQRG